MTESPTPTDSKEAPRPARGMPLLALGMMFVILATTLSQPAFIGAGILFLIAGMVRIQAERQERSVDDESGDPITDEPKT